MDARIWLAIAALCAACGDNSKACGPGTVDNHGSCVPVATTDAGNPCGPGTQLDQATGLCTVAASACGGGTILLNGNCVDPTQQLTISLEEGPEPNGLGVFEASNGAAGTIALAPVSDMLGFVIHGHTLPARDANGDGLLDPDYDTYLLAVSGPTLIRVRAHGLGMTGGFLVRAQVGAGDPLASWQRFGIATSTTIADRQIYLPVAGTYTLSIADTRSVLEHAMGGPIAAAPTGEYFVRIDQLAMPSATAAATTQTGAFDATTNVALYTLPAGQDTATLAIAAPQAAASLVLVNLTDNSVAAVGASVSATFSNTDAPLLAVDATYNTANEQIPYTLTVQTQ